MSKFEYASFYGGYDDFAVSKERFTMQEALTMYRLEKEHYKGQSRKIAVCDAFVCHRAGVNEDGEPCVGWWLEYKERKRSCPVWAFHIARPDEKFKNYMYFKLDKDSV